MIESEDAVQTSSGGKELIDYDASASSRGTDINEGPTCDGVQYHPFSAEGTITEKLNRELAISHLHRLQLQTNWRQVLVKEKFQELHDEIPKLIKYHDENVKWKLQVIDSYHMGIQDLQKLHKDAMVSNRNQIEELIAIHNDQVTKLEHNFRARVSSIRSQSQSEFEAINSRYTQEKDCVRLFLNRHEEKNNAEIQELHQKHQHELNVLKRQNLDQINDMRLIFGLKRKKIEDQLQQIHDEFAQKTDGTQRAYDELKSKDDALRKDVACKMKHADVLQREIRRFQLISMQEEAQIQEIHEELMARKVRAITKLNLMQAEMSRFREEQQTRLADFIKRANEKKEVLQRKCALASRVKKMALICQEMESSREKFASLLRDTNFANDMVSSSDEHGEKLVHKSEQRSIIISCMGRLGDRTHHFWNKYNIAQLDVLTLEKNVRMLKEREEDLRKKLKAYQDGITVNDDVLKNPNPLFVINGKMMTTPSKTPARDRRRLTVVDGNHFFVSNNMAQSV